MYKSKNFINTLFNYLLKEKKLTLLLVFSIIIFCVVESSISLLTEQIILSIRFESKIELSTSELRDWWGFSSLANFLISISVIVLNLIFFMIVNTLCSIIVSKIEVDLRNKILKKLLELDISYYSNKKIGEILTNVISDTRSVTNCMNQFLSSSITAIGQFFIAITISFILSWQVSIFTVIVFLIVILPFALLSKKANKKWDNSREIEEITEGNIGDKILNVKLIKTLGTEKTEKKYFQSENNNYEKASMEAKRFWALMMSILFGGMTLLTISTPLIAAFLFKVNFIKGQSDVFFLTKLPSFLIVQSTLIGSIQLSWSTLELFSTANASSKKIAELFNAKSLINYQIENEIDVQSISENIIFKDVEFRYPEKPEELILQKFNFTFKKGNSYAIVGETGAGKSTIAKLLMRFYDVSNGVILINGQDIKKLSLSSYLKCIGYVEQEPQIIYGNVWENIKYGNFEISKKEIIEACKVVKMHDVILSWQNGYETLLGERGSLLSGGQKQRLVLARIMLRKPDLLIFDEATSALDNLTEEIIQKEINKLVKNKISITIAHRLSTIKNVDQIIVFGKDSQKIIQQGSFNELVKQKGYFKNLYDAGSFYDKKEVI